MSPEARAPATSPAKSASTTPTPITDSPSPREGSTVFITRIISPAMNAAMEPTLRSSPPAVITKVMPTAMMPMKAERASTLVMLA